MPKRIKMAGWKCEKCGHYQEEYFEKCPDCGYPYGEPKIYTGTTDTKPLYRGEMED